MLFLIHILHPPKKRNHSNVKQRSLKSEQSVFSLKSSVAMKKGATSVCHEGDPLKQEMGLFLVSVALRLFVG